MSRRIPILFADIRTSRNIMDLILDRDRNNMYKLGDKVGIGCFEGYMPKASFELPTNTFSVKQQSVLSLVGKQGCIRYFLIRHNCSGQKKKCGTNHHKCMKNSRWHDCGMFRQADIASFNSFQCGQLSSVCGDKKAVSEVCAVSYTHLTLPTTCGV